MQPTFLVDTHIHLGRLTPNFRARLLVQHLGACLVPAFDGALFSPAWRDALIPSLVNYDLCAHSHMPIDMIFQRNGKNVMLSGTRSFVEKYHPA